MKPIESLTRQVDQWWRLYVVEAPRSRQPPRNQGVAGTLPHPAPMPVCGCQQPTPQKFSSPRLHPAAALVLAIVSLTSTMGYRFYNAPKLDEGTTASETIIAPYSAKIVDTKATEDKRSRARSGILTVLTIDEEVNTRIQKRLNRLLSQGTAWREIVGRFPFVAANILSEETQHYLRQAPEWEWRQVQEAVADRAKILLNSPTTDQQLAIAQLQAYRRKVSPTVFKSTLATIHRTRQAYAEALQAMQDLPASEATVVYDLGLFEWSDETWEATKQGIYLSQTRILTQGIPKGLPNSQLRKAIALQVKSTVPGETQAFAQELLVNVLQANLIVDTEATRLQAEQAAKAVEAVILEVQKGEKIIHSGEKITHEDFVKLDYFGLSQRGVNWLGLVGFGVLISGGIAVFWMVEQRFHPGMRGRDYLLVLLLTISAPILVSVGVPLASLPAIGLLLGSFYGSPLGVTVVALVSAILPTGMEVVWSEWLASAAGGLLGAFMAGRMRSREEIALLGIAVGVTQGVVALIVMVVGSAAVGAIWYTLLTAALLRSVGGIAWSIVALGLSPYLEHIFDLVTPIRLAELSNPNRPLLQRLATETPGTFQHTLFVATLAEAAAKALNCNVELVRAGALYHDIGKMHDPMGFIENQMGGPNKHETEIKNPWISADIIKKHVTEGLVMARKHRLPKAIQAFIPEHQGTMLIAYFYHQAQQWAEQDPSFGVREADFRYEGPIPQSRETGILMLADSCEAALRSLKDATYEEALSMVNKILKNRWQDQQLVDSGIRREEMPMIAEVFVRVWQQFHHKRVAYPKAALVAKS